MTAPPTVFQLVETFHRNRAAYTSPAYNETQLRREFIDPFFTALGWDVANTAGYAQAYQDVIHQDALKIAAATPNEKNILQRQITTTDNQIDNLVYQLYHLTKDEIKIVEDSNS